MTRYLSLWLPSLATDRIVRRTAAARESPLATIVPSRTTNAKSSRSSPVTSAFLQRTSSLSNELSVFEHRSREISAELPAELVGRPKTQSNEVGQTAAPNAARVDA